MKIEEALQDKKQELENIQKDIDSLEDQATALKDAVKKYNELKSKSAELKKTKRVKQKDYDTVIGFFSTVDDNYLDKIYPLFKNQNASVERATA